MTSQWCHHDVTTEENICPSSPLTRDGHICPSSPLTRDGHICPSSPLTRDGHICPSSPVRVNRVNHEFWKKCIRYAIPVLINSTEPEIKCKFITKSLQIVAKYFKNKPSLSIIMYKIAIYEVVISVIERRFTIQIIISFHFNFISHWWILCILKLLYL